MRSRRNGKVGNRDSQRRGNEMPRMMVKEDPRR